MATRGIVAVETPDGWEGSYKRMDGRPTWFGELVWGLLHRMCAGDPELFVSRYIYTELEEGEEQELITHETVEPDYDEWCYVISPTHLTVWVVDWEEGVFVPVDTFELAGPEPRWDTVEQLGHDIVKGRRQLAHRN